MKLITELLDTYYTISGYLYKTIIKLFTLPGQTFNKNHIYRPSRSISNKDNYPIPS
jgi:hypothetical protein